MIVKYLLIAMVRVYQNFFSKYTPHCLYKPTCSEYCILAIQKYGVIKGLKKFHGRISRCNIHYIEYLGTEDWP